MNNSQPTNPDDSRPADQPDEPADAARQRFYSSRESCSYLPDQFSRLEHEFVPALSADDYADRVLHGWRRFGTIVFRPRCRTCRACRTLRVDARRFRPNRSQQRARKRNEGTIEPRICPPRMTKETLKLYQRFHTFQTEARGWRPLEDDDDAASYMGTFILNPFPTQEWRYRLDDRLVGVGYVDELPIGLSAIYFFHDPDHRDRSLGTWNVLCLLDRCRALGLPHLYLGYHVEGCRSLEYKARFRPNEILDDQGQWVEYLA